MKIVKYLGNLGYGSRRDVTALVERQGVRRRDGSVVRDGDAFVHDDLLVDGMPLDPPPGSLIMLDKPTGYTCSTSDRGSLIYELLPPRFLRRTPVMASVGRLDRDTSGLLLITDDGKLNHRLSSPRTHLVKTYEAELATDLQGHEGALFESGTLMLNGETTPLAPAMLEVVAPRTARLHLTEGRYHQVRRMFAAAGNRVTALRRIAMGPLTLAGLASGEWRALHPDEVHRLLSE